MCAVPMIALNDNLHHTLADRRVSSLEGSMALSPWVRAFNIDPIAEVSPILAQREFCTGVMAGFESDNGD